MNLCELIERGSAAGTIAFGDIGSCSQELPYIVQESPIMFSCLSLPSINNKLQQPEAASGVLEYAMKHFGELVSTLPFPLFRLNGRLCLDRTFWVKACFLAVM